MRDILRRLDRLEARVCRATERISILIHFVDPEKGVTGTLLLGPGNERVWTNLQARQEDATATRPSGGITNDRV
jgi:hypothetical protein